MTNHADHDAYRDLVAAHALDALDATDLPILEGHLAGCGECRELLADLRRVAVSVGSTVDRVAPPPSLKARTLARATGQSGTAANVTPFPASTANASPARSRSWLALAASLALAAGLGFYAWALRSELDVTRGALAELSIRLETMRADLVAARQDSARLANTMNVLRSPDVIRVDLRATGAPVGPAARAYVSASRGLIFDAENLPRLAAGRTYQLWVVPAGAGRAPVSAGVFSADPGGRSAMTIELPAGVTQVAAVAVSEEPAGGSPQPTSTPFLLGTPVNN